jgi:hypothetical protein
MNAAEIVVREVQGDGGFQVRQLFAERISEPRKTAHRHSHGQVLPFDKRSADLSGVRIAEADFGYNPRDARGLPILQSDVLAFCGEKPENLNDGSRLGLVPEFRISPACGWYCKRGALHYGGGICHFSFGLRVDLIGQITSARLPIFPAKTRLFITPIPFSDLACARFECFFDGAETAQLEYFPCSSSILHGLGHIALLREPLQNGVDGCEWITLFRQTASQLIQLISNVASCEGYV